ncbi:peptidase, partial [Mesorhizobium sp. M00.F.Ca.ET.186.01.1.1]
MNVEDLQRQAAEAERARVTEITQLCRTFSMDDAEFIRTGATVQAVKDAILQKQISANKPQATSVVVQTEEADKFRAAASDALLMRAGRHVEKPAAGALELRSLR